MSEFQNQHERFDAVWQRVIAAQDKPEQPISKEKKNGDEAQLREFMEDEAFIARYYCALANAVNGQCRAVVRKIANDERTHLKKLRTAYFILTGQEYTPRPVTPKIISVPEALRKRYIGENETCDAYMKASSNTARRDLAEMYRRLSEDEMHHAECINMLLEGYMG